MPDSKHRRFHLRWLRFRLRTLLGAVAVVALTLGLLRYCYYLSIISIVHAQVGAGYGVAALRARDNIAWINYGVDGFPSEKNRKLEVRYTARWRYHHELSEKYRRAVWQPWLALQRDPDPPPEAELPTKDEGSKDE